MALHLEEDGDLVGVGLLGQYGGHEFDRVVGFRIRGVAEHRIGCGVRLVEAVLGELFQQGEDRGGGFRIDVVGRFGAFDKRHPFARP